MNNIGLIGFGCVGQGFYNILGSKYPELQVKKVVAKNPEKKREVYVPVLFDAEEVIYDKEIRIVVEAIDDARAAFIYAKKTLEQGKILVTANKKMVAENMEELKEYVKNFGGKIFYEAAVCGSIPIIKNINSYFRNEKISKISGILNGSSNFILTQMTLNGQSYEDALKDAQARGFAESDPTLDVEGIDAANKLSILCFDVFGTYISPTDIDVEGITGIDQSVIEEAKNNGSKIKLIATVKLKDDSLALSVKPEAVSENHPLYHVDHEFNSVLVEGEFSGVQQLTGKGAGSFPTGLAVTADVIDAIEILKDNEASLV